MDHVFIANAFKSLLRQELRHECVGGGGKQDFADIAQRSRGNGKKLGYEIGGWGGGGAPS